MSKQITSPVKRFHGSVTIADPMNVPQFFAYSPALRHAQALEKTANIFEGHYALLPGLLACVEKWEIAAIPDPKPETFPATPTKAVQRLLAWLLGEVVAVFKQAEEAPNE